MRITSKDNQSIKLAKKLHTKKERKNNNLFIIEGEKLIREALSAKITLTMLFYKEGYSPDFDLEEDTECFELPEHFMEFIATTDSAPPFLAIAETISWLDQDTDSDNFLLLVNELQDPGNFGSIIRTAEATGVDCIIATKGTVDLFNPKVVRGSMGSVFRQPVIYIDKADDFLDELKTKNWQFVLTTPYAEKDFYSVDYTKKSVIVIGNEGQGLNPELLSNYEGIKIPMLGDVESLNTSIATSLILYEVIRQRKSV